RALRAPAPRGPRGPRARPPRRAPDRSGRLGPRLLDQRGERLRIRDRQLRQVLAVDLDPGLVEAVDQLAVGQAVLARGRVDARDPQAAEGALALLAVPVGIGPGALDGLARDPEQAVARARIALRLLQDSLVA